MSGSSGVFKGPFETRLADLSRSLDPASRRWLFVPYDQLSDRMGPLARLPPRELGLVLIECPDKGNRRPYHQQKLGYVLGNLRHFALEQAERGVYVRHIVARSYLAGLSRLVPVLGPMLMMEAAERELRHELEPLVMSGGLEVIPHEGWLTSTDDFLRSQKRPPWKMEPFYQHVRRHTGILMDGGEPVGGAFNFDADNRRPWREGKDPAPPRPPEFETDEVTAEVIDLIRTHYGHHPGRLDPTTLPTTAHDTKRLWYWALHDCLPHFGPYEDAMSTRSSGLFHTRISPLLNLHRVLPREVVADVEKAPIDLPSKEGFIRQVLGWREYVRHVHQLTDGLRKAPAPASPELERPGDGGYARWRKQPWPAPDDDGTPGGACPSVLGAKNPLPPAFWGQASGLRCLDSVVADVWREGYSHHITRLMVLSNLGTTLDIDPRELTDWFWVAYIDAYDWVVEPNVLGMGTYAMGGLMTTKPYVSGAAYIDKMSDYCRGCRFDPKKNCPVTSLYWDFLARHEVLLKQNGRTAGAIAGLSRRSGAQRTHDAEVAATTRAALEAGLEVYPHKA